MNKNFEDNHNKLIDLSQVRLVVIFGIFSILFLVLIIRSVDLILLTDKPSTDSQSKNKIATPIIRSEIFDRNHVLLATNVVSASIYANPQEIINKIKVSNDLSLALEGVDSSELLKKLSSSKSFVWVKRQVSPREHFSVNSLGIPGVKFQKEVKRVFTQGPLFSHVLGNVDIDNQGLSGIEKKLNEKLISDESGIHLTIDSRVQHALRDELSLSMRRFSAIGAAGIVLDVNNGEILALISLPDFDPNLNKKPSDNKAFNRATLGSYEMGSTFKPFTVAAALENGIINLKDSYDATKPLRVSRFIIRDDHPKNKWLSIPEIFMYSSNIGMARMAQDLGPDQQRAFLKELGILDRPDFEISEVGKPIYPHRWKELSSMTISYGHGIAVNLLQLASAYAVLVNGGNKINPTLLVRDEKKSQNLLEVTNQSSKKIISEETSQKIRGLLRLTVKSGTAKQADIQGYEIGGKTGTANKPGDGAYKKDSIITSFVGVFPMDKPKYAVAVMLDEPKGIKETHFYRSAGWTAAPTVGKVISRVGALLNVQPSKEKKYWKNFEATYISVRRNE